MADVEVGGGDVVVGVGDVVVGVIDVVLVGTNTEEVVEYGGAVVD